MADASHGSDGDSDDTGRRAARAGSGQVLAEVMVRPGSEMAGRTLEEVAFRHKHPCIVLGIERRSRMLRERITRMPLKDGRSEERRVGQKWYSTGRARWSTCP